MTSLSPQVSGPRRKRITTFSFKGVVAASSKEGAVKVREAVEHLTKIISVTHKTCIDETIPLSLRHAKLAEITCVERDLLEILYFSKEETELCKVERIKAKMHELSHNIEVHTKSIQEEFIILRTDSHIYQKIFDDIMQVIENITSFFKERHSVEKARVLEIAFDSVQEVRKIRDSTDEDSLVEYGRVASRKCLDLLRATKRLISVQEATSRLLTNRIDSAHILLQTSLPSLLMKSKEYLDFPSEENLERQYEAVKQIVAIIEEIIGVVKDVVPDYDSSFEDKIVNVDDPNKFRLNEAIEKVSSLLTKLHTFDNSEDPSSIKHEVIDLTRNIIPNLPITNDEKLEFVSAVKQGLEPSHKDYFQSQKKLATIVNKPKAVLNEIHEDDGSKDMLGVAKEMLSALKDISQSLETAPELRNNV